MRIFNKAKDTQGTRLYFLGITVYELKKTQETDTTYLFGVKVRSKLSRNAKARLAEQRIQILASINQQTNYQKRHFLLFDHLSDQYAEAIDAWTLFQYMKENNIPAKYVILQNNKLYQKLKKNNKLDNILAVRGELDFLEKYASEIANAHTVLTSFGFFVGNNIFKRLSHVKYIFIEHGVILLNEWAAKLYSDQGEHAADRILVPTRATKELYDRLGIWKNKMYCCGLPRWDSQQLNNSTSNTKIIYIFFTMRASFLTEPKLRETYLSRIQDLINSIHEILINYPDIKLYITPHHTLVHQEENCFSFFNNVNIVPPEEMSCMIKNTDLFITDYSSACFDLIYKNIPVIFYSFDSDIHYSNERDNNPLKAAKNIEKHLYNSCYDKQSVLKKIRYYADNGFKLEDNNIKKNNALFWNKGNNCEQLVKLINEDTYTS